MLTSRWRRVLPFLAVVAVLSMTACTDGSGGASGSPDASGEQAGGVVVSGDFGDTPEIEVPEGDPPAGLETSVASEGPDVDGTSVAEGDLIVVNYQGEVWETGNTFDSSFDRDAPFATSIGTGSVIPGWDQGLVDQPVGARVVLVIPPEDAYGEQGTEGIPPDSTLVFVVDILGSYSSADAATGPAVEGIPKDVPSVTGEVGQEPALELSKAKPRTSSRSTLVNQGTGEELVEGQTLVVEALQVAYPDGEVDFSSWSGSPLTFTPELVPGLTEALEGQAVGARVVSEIAAEDNEGTAIVLVIDVIGAF